MCCACPVTSALDNPFNALPLNWASDAELKDLASNAEGRLLGWMPTGEPDVTDPDLVNRIF